MISPDPHVPPLAGPDAAELLRCARHHVESAVRRQPATAGDLPPALAQIPVSGVFVTLRNGDDLRACIGNWHHPQPTPLGPALTLAARTAATGDFRFPPIHEPELPRLALEVSVLHSPRRIEAAGKDRAREVAVGRHGLVVEAPGHRGMLLPQVARELGWDAHAFLTHAARKAGLPDDAWRSPSTTLTTFEAVRIAGPPP